METDGEGEYIDGEYGEGEYIDGEYGEGEYQYPEGEYVPEGEYIPAGKIFDNSTL